MRPTQGVSFGGRYELESRIAIGGMGEVWEATDHVIGRTVAIKILKDEYMGDPGFLERFRAEARHAALVNHEGIASVFDYGEENGSAFLVMELVPGEALSTILEREGSLSTDKTLDIVAQTSLALQAAHSAGLVHRDIKPGNLLITPDGRVKITDFGIARIADQVPLTATGQVMGTVQYLSPEQASGHPASPATDIYSLGIVAYESVAGKRPFTGESQVAIAMAQINEQPPPLPPTVADPVQKLIFAMIAKKPDERPASASAVARASSALRRGDLDAAHAAVPMIALAAMATDDVTRLLTSPNDVDDPTQLMPTTTPVPLGDDEAEEKKRSPWTWPLIALIILLLLVLGGTLWAVLAGQGAAEPDPSTSSATPSSAAPTTPSETPAPEPTSVNIDTLGLMGMACDAAKQTAEDAGLTKVSCVLGDAAGTADQENTVYRVEPQANVDFDQEVTLTYYGPVTPIGSPTSAAEIRLDGETQTTPEVEATKNAYLYWQSFQCPSGTGSATAYNMKVTNGVFTINGSTAASFGIQDQGPGAEILVDDKQGSQLQVTYTVTCDGGAGGARESGASPVAQATIVPATPAADSTTAP